MRKRLYFLGFFSLAIGCSAVWFAFANRPSGEAMTTVASNEDAGAASGDSAAHAAFVRVETVKPQQGGIQRTTTQPGTVVAFESAQLFARVAGYLKSQVVDIGDHVKRDDVLATIDAPELLKEVDEAKSKLEQARAQVLQADARVTTAEADQEAALAAIKQAEAGIEKARSFRAFREKQYQRIYDLFKLKSVDERLVDEKQDEMEAARAAESLARAGVDNSKALAAAAAARIEQAKADAVDARANVDVAAAALAKAEVFAGYLNIVSPYDGVVTQRNFFRGDFIRSADQSGHTPLLAIDRVDQMRVVVQVPDPDVPFTNRGDEAVVQIDNLPGVRFAGKVSRTADAEDAETRTMRVEIDLPNLKGLLRQGMYGRVTIQLGTLPGALRIPSSSLAGEVADGKSTVYVCKESVAHQVGVEVGKDDGLHIEILRGLSAEDEVILHPRGALFDGARVNVVNPAENTEASAKDSNRK